MAKPKSYVSLLQQLTSLLICLLILAAGAVSYSGKLWGHRMRSPKNEATEVTDTAAINTTTLGKEIMGFAGPTPVEIHLANGKVRSITPLPNEETPSFFGRVLDSGLLESWNGLTPAEGLKKDVDAVTGATYSSNAVISNVRAGLTQAAHTEVKPADKYHLEFNAAFIIGLLVILCGAVIPWFTRSKAYRVAQLAADVVVLGLWCGCFVSYTSMVGFMANGITISASLLVLILILIGLIFPLLGRPSHYCLWLCPMGAAQELVGKCSRRKLKLSTRVLKTMEVFKQILWCVLMLLLWFDIWGEWMNYELFTAFLFRDVSIWILITAGLFLVISIFIPRPYCKMICPTGTLLRLSGYKFPHQKQ